jgi:hypothetical protein
VLAAVAILAILYTVLAGAAMDGLLAEGTSKRRLEASLIADRSLAELELQLDAGIVPPLGEEQTELGDFRVILGVEPYDLVLPELQTASGAPAPLLADLTGDRRSPLRRIEIRVAWMEAEVEYQVFRSSFAFDANALDPSLLPEVNAEAGPPPAQPAQTETP